MDPFFFKRILSFITQPWPANCLLFSFLSLVWNWHLRDVVFNRNWRLTEQHNHDRNDRPGPNCAVNNYESEWLFISARKQEKTSEMLVLYVTKNFNWFLYRHSRFCFSAITLRCTQFFYCSTNLKKFALFANNMTCVCALLALVEILDRFVTISLDHPAGFWGKQSKRSSFVQVLDQILP